MKKFIFFFSLTALLTSFIISCRSPQDSSALKDPNTLTPEEIADGWQLLFDGKTLDGWKRFNQDTIGPLWSVQDGSILCNGQGLTEGTANIGGSLITTRKFNNFELILDYKVTKGGNSGVLYHVVEAPEFKFDYESGPEFQLMDDSGWEGDLREEQKAGGNYDMYAASASKKVNPAGEWNTARIIYYDGHVEHWLNGDKVLEFEEDSDDFRERYNKSKWKDYPAWNKAKTGVISLQDHGAPVYFRNIRIKEL
ncbi:MAG: DUF1080 domain-containing protein [Cyclobacteriaceae bacterium]